MATRPVEHRKVNRLGVNQLDIFAPPTQPVDHKHREPDTHPVGTIRAIKDEERLLISDL